MQVFERGIDEAIIVQGTTIRVLEVLDGEVRLAITSPHSPYYQEVTLACSQGDDDQSDDEADDFKIAFDLAEDEAAELSSHV